ncbi:prephenate dehydratase [Silvanigrella sp.]|uniref:prephenate dehydratase n=1 Tax=Silvanigrella sp. TaxID=2024976 RepID=UPI0037C6B86D|nr:hypothetical protein [Silvanigrellaceae bacterium]
MILGVSGDVGSFSEEAAIKYSKQTNHSFELKYLIDIEGVLTSLTNHSIQFGIFPVVNLKGGLVKTAFEAMGKYHFKYIENIFIEIEHNLITKNEVSLNEITTIVSHPQAFAQCQKYLKSNFPNAEYIEWKNTALAARNLSEGLFPLNTAVIGHKKTASLYNLKIREEKIQDEFENLTAFIIVENI